MLKSLPGFVALTAEEREAVLLEASRYCPDLSFWREPTELHRLPLPFYPRYSLIRVGWTPQDQTPGEIFALYAPGSFRPIDEAGETLAWADKTLPLAIEGDDDEATLSRLKQYLCVRIALLGSSGDRLTPGNFVQSRLVDDDIATAIGLTCDKPAQKYSADASVDSDGQAVYSVSAAILHCEPQGAPYLATVDLSVWPDGHLFFRSPGIQQTVELSADDFRADENGRALWRNTPRSIIPPPSFLRWVVADEKLAEKVRESLKASVESTSVLTIRAASLAFYRSLQLVQVVSPKAPSLGERRSDVRYALCRLHEGRFDIFPLTGASAPIHDANDTRAPDGELEPAINSSTAAAYLTFFCWAVDGDEGHFLIPSTANELPFTGRHSVEQNQVLYGEGARFSIESVATGSGVELRARCLYGGALFDSKFAVQATGSIEMIEDDPPVAKLLPVESQRFGAGGLLPFAVGLGLTEKSPSAASSMTAGAASEDIQPSMDGFVSIHEAKLLAPDEFKLLVVKDEEFSESYLLTPPPPGHSLAIVRCRFRQGVRLAETKNIGSIFFIGCTFFANSESKAAPDVAIDLAHAELAGSLTFERCAIRGRLVANGLRVERDVSLRAVRVAPDDRFLTGSFTRNDIDQESLMSFLEKKFTLPALVLSGSKVGGRLELTFDRWDDPNGNGQLSVVAGTVDLSNCFVDGNLILAGLWCADSIDIRSSTIRGDLSACLGWYTPQLRCSSLDADLAHFEGNCDLGYANVRGTCSFQQATVHGCLELLYSQIRDDLYLHNVEVLGFTNLSGASIGGYLDLGYARLRDVLKADRRLRFDKPLRVKGDVYLTAAEIKHVRFCGVVIEGKITARTGHFGRLALTLGIEKPRAEGNGWWPVGCTVGALDFQSVDVDGDVDLTGLQVQTKGAWTAYRLTIADNLEAGPSVVLSGCEIGGHLRFSMRDPCFEIEKGILPTEGVLRWAAPGRDDSNEALPTQADIRSTIPGKLDLRATTIGASLNLQNVFVEGDILLSDVVVKLDLEAGGQRVDRWGTSKYDLECRCGGFDMQGADCGGDAALTGLRVLSRGRSAWRRLSLPADISSGDFLGRGAIVGGVVGLCEWGDGANSESHAKVDGLFDLSASDVNRLILDKKNFSKRASDNRRSQDWKVNLERAKISRLDIRRPPPPLDLTAIRIDRWEIHNAGGEQNEGDEYVEILTAMDPLDRDVWISIELALRNNANQRDADRVYVAMRQEGRRRRILKAIRRASGHAHTRTAHRSGRASGGRKATADGAPGRWQRSRAALGLGWGYWMESAHGVLFAYGTSPGRAFWAVNMFLMPLMLAIFLQAANVTASGEQLEGLAARCEHAGDAVPGCRQYKAALSEESLDVRLSPDSLGASWGLRDALTLWLRYELPIIAVTTDTSWIPAGGTNAQIGPMILPCTPRGLAFLTATANWILLPLYVGFLAARLVRRSG